MLFPTDNYSKLYTTKEDASLEKAFLMCCYCYWLWMTLRCDRCDGDLGVFCEVDPVPLCFRELDPAFEF